MFILPADKRQEFILKPLDAKGRPAKVDDVPTWSLSAEGAVSLEVAEDGMKAFVNWLAPDQTVQLNVQADADLGDGVQVITGMLEIQTLPAQAVTFEIKFIRQGEPPATRLHVHVWHRRRDGRWCECGAIEFGKGIFDA